jgi:hypothetical protein
MHRFALAVLILQTLHAAEAVREVSSDAFVIPNAPIPGYYRGYFYFLDRPTGIRVYGPDGHLALATSIQERTGGTYIRNFAIASDGTMAISWSTRDIGSERHAGIEFLDAKGGLVRSIDTGLYNPAHLAYDDSKTLWAFGWLLGNRSRQDYMTIRKFSADGKQIGAFLPRSAFPKGLDPAPASWQQTRITVTKDRIGVLAFSGDSSSKQEWVELDLQGNLLGRWRFDDSNSAQVAMTADGHVYAEKNDAHPNARFFVLDRAAAAWKSIAPPSADRFYGTDGDQLVFLDWWRNGGRLNWRWFDQT